MWIQNGNSRRWSIYQDGDLYYSFRWFWQKANRWYATQYHIQWAISRSISTDWVWNHGGLGPDFPSCVDSGYLPEQFMNWGGTREFFSKEQKNKEWKLLHQDPIGYIIRKKLV